MHKSQPDSCTFCLQLHVTTNPGNQAWMSPADMTSSIKPEVHNVSQRQHRRTEPRTALFADMRENFDHDRNCNSGNMLADRQTDRQTDTQTDTVITVLRCAIGGGVQIGNASVPIQLTQCLFPWLAIRNAKMLIYFSNKMYGSKFYRTARGNCYGLQLAKF